MTVDGLADENGTDYTVNATGNASVVVEPGPPEEPPGLERARTLDGDGTYDDLNGDSRTTVIDVATMLEERNTIDRMPENARLGSEKNGDGGFSVVDVAAFLGDVRRRLREPPSARGRGPVAVVFDTVPGGLGQSSTAPAGDGDVDRSRSRYRPRP